MIWKKLSLRTQNNIDGSISILIPFGLYSKNTVFKACYKCLDNAHVKVATMKKNFVVDIESKNPKIKGSEIVIQICDDLIDFELRESISIQTKEIRTALVEKAFASLPVV